MDVRLFLTYLALLCPVLSVAGNEEPAWRSPWKGVPELVPLLGSVPEGKKILALAAAKDPQFLTRIKIGDASFTESTFARTYSLLDGKEQIDLRHEITLSKKLALSDALVDFAHELVHFTEKDMPDPYRPGFEMKEFVKRGIEGEGGELHALEEECKVAWALQRKYKSFPRHRLCAPYKDSAGNFHREKARADYYALGAWFEKAPETLKKTVPEVSAKPVVFTSSYARKPYPLALAEEFAVTRNAACENNRRKYRLISAQSESGRMPASHSDVIRRERMRLKAYERLYCSEQK
jgi:hypothetical protein